jgi:carbamoyl-phosphate synthase large subunit
VNLLFSCIGRRGYVAGWFREHLSPGDRIVGTTNTPWTPGLHACDKGVLMPDLGSPDYLPTLLELCRKEEIRAVFSFFDLDVDVIARARDRFLDAGVLPVVPDARASRIGLDKLETVAFLREHGFRAPRTFTELDAVRAALREGSLDYPLFVKPRHGFASQNLFLARNEEELSIFFAYAPDMIVQERLRGSEHSLDVLNDLEGRVVSVVVKRKVLMRAGETDQAETVQHPAALALGERLGRALAHVGPLDVDLFIDGDALTVLELNPRFGGAYPVSHLAGADFPRKILAMLRGERVERDVGRYEIGIRMMKDYAILPAYAGELVDLRSRSRSG